MDSLDELLKSKANQLDLSAKISSLELAQQVIDRHFPSFARVVKLRDKKVFIKVTSSAAASEVRLRQMVVIEEIRRVARFPAESLVIRQ